MSANVLTEPFGYQGVLRHVAVVTTVRVLELVLTCLLDFTPPLLHLVLVQPDRLWRLLVAWQLLEPQEVQRRPDRLEQRVWQVPDAGDAWWEQGRYVAA